MLDFEQLTSNPVPQPSNVKLQRVCPSSSGPVPAGADPPSDSCVNCYCRPMWCVDCMAKWYCIIFLLDIVLEKDENLDVVSPTERTKKDDMMKTNDAMKTDGAIGKDVVVGDQWLNPALRISFDDISLCNYRVIFKISLKYRYRIFFENITRY